MVKNIAFSFALFIGIVNLVVMYAFWVSSEKIDIFYHLGDNELGRVLVDKLSTNIAIFEAIIGLIAIFFGVLAIFGYQQIKEISDDVVRKRADNFLKEARSEIIEQVIEEVTKKLTPSGYTAQDFKDSQIRKEGEKDD
jgi:hypothetical protein